MITASASASEVEVGGQHHVRVAELVGQLGLLVVEQLRRAGADRVEPRGADVQPDHRVPGDAERDGGRQADVPHPHHRDGDVGGAALASARVSSAGAATGFMKRRSFFASRGETEGPARSMHRAGSAVSSGCRRARRRGRPIGGRPRSPLPPPPTRSGGRGPPERPDAASRRLRDDRSTGYTCEPVSPRLSGHAVAKRPLRRARCASFRCWPAPSR